MFTYFISLIYYHLSYLCCMYVVCMLYVCCMYVVVCCILYFVFCILYFVFYILYFIFYILYFIFYILYFIFYILYFILYIIYFCNSYLSPNYKTYPNTKLTEYRFELEGMDKELIEMVERDVLDANPQVVPHPLDSSSYTILYLTDLKSRIKSQKRGFLLLITY